jgi:hypothetical protein
LLIDGDTASSDASESSETWKYEVASLDEHTESKDATVPQIKRPSPVEAVVAVGIVRRRKVL